MSDQKISLLVLAAGMGSRYGGLKQLDELGPNGETILEYSIYDAIQAGFSKVVFVIRDFFQEEFEQKVGSKFKDQIEVGYVCQPVNPEINGFADLPIREKPWGTSHAVLVADDLIDEPFAVINADDYYGQQCFEIMSEFLRNEATPHVYSMVGYQLKNTLSDMGTVNRGVCATDEKGNLSGIVETLKIRKDDRGVVVHGPNAEQGLSEDDVVSMNFWGFHPDIFRHLHAGFRAFVAANKDNSKAEYYIPLIIDDLIKSGEVEVKLLTSTDHWYGVTYKEDAEHVKAAFARFGEEGKYPHPMWS